MKKDLLITHIKNIFLELKEESQSVDLLKMKIKNPETGNNIMLKSALGYPKDSKVYKAAATAYKKGADALGVNKNATDDSDKLDGDSNNQDEKEFDELDTEERTVVQKILDTRADMIDASAEKQIKSQKQKISNKVKQKESSYKQQKSEFETYFGKWDEGNDRPPVKNGKYISTGTKKPQDHPQWDDSADLEYNWQTIHQSVNDKKEELANASINQKREIEDIERKIYMNAETEKDNLFNKKNVSALLKINKKQIAAEKEANAKWDSSDEKKNIENKRSELEKDLSDKISSVQTQLKTAKDNLKKAPDDESAWDTANDLEKELKKLEKNGAKRVDSKLKMMLFKGQEKFKDNFYKQYRDDQLKGIREIVRTELSELLSENTNSLNQAYVVYTKALKSFEQNANKLNDKVMLKIYKELDKLHLKITQHLDANYEGSLDESYADTMKANLPRASFAELDEAKDALESLLKNTRNDRDLLKLYKAHLKLTKVFQKHLDKNYPDWDKRMEENTKTINVRHKTTKKQLDIPDDPDTIKKYKKMGYTLWIGSRKKNESTNERTIQEHDKAKVLQAMLKAGSNKAEAQALLKKHYAYVDKKYRDVPASKKAEIIVTLAGTASEAKINERSESYREAELKKVAQFTDRNQHLEARHFVARKGGYEKHRKAYQALIDLQGALGHTPRGADQVRSDLDKDLKKYLSKDVDNWEEVWGNL